MKQLAVPALIVVLLVAVGVGWTRVELQARMHAETLIRLNAAVDALLDYVAARGHFPCPADAQSNGREPEGADHRSGICPTWYGFLPAAELGMSRLDPLGYKVDGWGGPDNRIRYAVSHMTVRTVTNPFTRRGGMRSVGVESVGTEYLLWVCGSADGVFEGSTCGTAPVLTSKTPAVIWSVGRNARTGGRSADEAENPNPNGGSEDAVFVSRPRSTREGDEFDDVVTWIPLPLLVNRMISARHLP